jgi:hypothetical protein
MGVESNPCQRCHQTHQHILARLEWREECHTGSNLVRVWHSNLVGVCFIPIFCIPCCESVRHSAHPHKIGMSRTVPHKIGMPHTLTRSKYTHPHKNWMPPTTHEIGMPPHTLAKLESTHPHKMGMPPHTLARLQDRNAARRAPHKITHLAKLNCLKLKCSQTDTHTHTHTMPVMSLNS